MVRGSAWLVVLAAAAALLAAALWPIVAAALSLVGAGGPAATDVAGNDLPGVFLATGLYTLLITAAAVVLGWPVGRLLARVRRGRAVLAVLTILPICMPAYVVFYTWWQAWPAGSALGAWVIRHDLVPFMRSVTLVVALACWSWPLVAWCVAALPSAGSARREEMLLLDGAGRARRLLDAVRGDARGLGIGALLVALMTLGNTTCFDLAFVYTVANEVRALDAVGAGARQTLLVALPVLAATVVGAAAVWFALGRSAPRSAGPPARPRRGLWIAAGLVWMLTVALPAALLARSLVGLLVRGGGHVSEFFHFYGAGLAGTAGLAVCSGIVAAVAALGLAICWFDGRRWVRGLGHAQAIAWLVVGLLPATVIGVALEAAYNVPLAIPGAGEGRGATVAGMIYGGPAILVLAHLARFGFVAALLARWVADAEPRALADLRRADGARTLGAMIVAQRARLLPAAAAVLAITAVLALGEIPVTKRVHPPGSDALAVSLLNAMHYQRPETVVIACAVLLLAACLAAALLVLVVHPFRRHAAVLLLVAIVGAGCSGGAEGEPEVLDVDRAFGVNGTALGQFAYPRAIAVDPDREYVYVIDKTARVQRFGFDGKPQLQWDMPAKENGKPTGVSVAPDGRVFVADTHYHRVIAFDESGTELMRFGSYGEGPGEFIYPTDVAFGSDGRLYVGEYGGHDRVQIFSPEGEYLSEFGCFGPDPGCFDRPQALQFDARAGVLYVADSCNHQIVVVDPDGRELRRFGGAGRAPGQLHYPYGLHLLDDGSLLVAEFGNARLQHFSAAGESQGLFGRLGAGPGELRYPWGVAGTDRDLFVLDSGNNRVQVTRTP
jgi:DNA-binding beta-propeller fold protein YncE/ABC-type Fe3+ transport system permease subunit